MNKEESLVLKVYHVDNTMTYVVCQSLVLHKAQFLNRVPKAYKQVQVSAYLSFVSEPRRMWQNRKK